MEIAAPNALLLLQVVHFLVAYFILKHLLLKPGLKVLRKSDAPGSTLNPYLALFESEVDLQNALVKDQWGRHCAVLRSRMPVVAKAGSISRIQCERVSDSLSATEERQAITDLKNVVVETVSGGR